MHTELRQAYDREMHAAAAHYSGNNLAKAFGHLERAHILGQSFDIRACESALVDAEGRLETPGPDRDTRSSGEDYRCVAIFTIWVPLGNTGGAYVHPFRSMPIPEEFQALLNKR